MTVNKKMDVTIYRCPECNTKLEPEQDAEEMKKRVFGSRS
jgi:uncharacterized protein with PIN domain